jgi:hypothetical protein
MPAEANARTRSKRAIERRNLWAAEDAAHELPTVNLDEALAVVHLYAERGSPKYEKAALRWLERYLFDQTLARALRCCRSRACATWAALVASETRIARPALSRKKPVV